MARIEELGFLLARHGAHKAIVQSDEPVKLECEQGRVEGPVVGHRQLISLVEEILPEELFADLVMLEPVGFDYEHELGRIHLRVVPGPSVWRVVLDPSDEFLEEARRRRAKGELPPADAGGGAGQDKAEDAGPGPGGLGAGMTAGVGADGVGEGMAGVEGGRSGGGEGVGTGEGAAGVMGGVAVAGVGQRAGEPVGGRRAGGAGERAGEAVGEGPDGTPRAEDRPFRSEGGGGQALSPAETSAGAEGTDGPARRAPTESGFGSRGLGARREDLAGLESREALGDEKGDRRAASPGGEAASGLAGRGPGGEAEDEEPTDLALSKTAALEGLEGLGLGEPESDEVPALVSQPASVEAVPEAGWAGGGSTHEEQSSAAGQDAGWSAGARAIPAGAEEGEAWAEAEGGVSVGPAAHQVPRPASQEVAASAASGARRTPPSSETLDLRPGSPSSSEWQRVEAALSPPELPGQALRSWVREAVRLSSPQLLLVPGQRPWVLSGGAYGPLPKAQVRLTPQDLDGLVAELDQEGRARLKELGSVRFVAREPEGGHRVRVSLFQDAAGARWASLRIHLLEERELRELGLPPDAALKADGRLTVVVGPGLAGVTTTLVALTDALLAAGRRAGVYVGRPPELQLRSPAPVVSYDAAGRDLDGLVRMATWNAPAVLLADDVLPSELAHVLRAVQAGIPGVVGLRASSPMEALRILLQAAEQVLPEPAGFLAEFVSQVIFQVLVSRRGLGQAAAFHRVLPDGACWQALLEGREENASRLIQASTDVHLRDSLARLVETGIVSEHAAARILVAAGMAPT